MAENDRDAEMRRKARELMRRLSTLERQDLVKDQVERLSTREAEERRFQRIMRELREEEDEQFAPSGSDATPHADDGKIVSLSAHRAAQAVRQTGNDTRGVANDIGYDEHYRLAASSSDGPAGWTPTDLQLRLSDRMLPIYVNPGEDGSVFVRAVDCAEGWTGLNLGGFPYELVPSASDPAWIGIDGCDETTLRKAAKGGRDIDADAT